MNTLQGINTKSYTGAVSPQQRWSQHQRNCPVLSYHTPSKTSVICLSNTATSYSARTFASYDPFHREAYRPTRREFYANSKDSMDDRVAHIKDLDLKDWRRKNPNPIYHNKPLINDLMGISTIMSPAYEDALMKVSPAVVGLSSRKGDQKRFEYGSGTIIHRDGIIITSAIHKNCAWLEENNLIDVTMGDGESLEGTVLYVDTQCNIAIIKITPETSLPIAKLATSHEVRLGDRIFTLGRDGTSCLMATSGQFSGQSGPFEEFLKLRLNVQTGRGRNIMGGPVVNLHGEVIGVNFFDVVLCYHFVPIGIIHKCLEHLEKFGTDATDADAI